MKLLGKTNKPSYLEGNSLQSPSSGVFNTISGAKDRFRQNPNMPVKGLKLVGSLRSARTPSKHEGNFNTSTDVEDMKQDSVLSSVR
jgi:hypothetical protein